MITNFLNGLTVITPNPIHGWIQSVYNPESPTRRRTLSTRRPGFPCGGTRAWNALPARVRSAPSLSSFRSQLKTHLLCVSFPEQSNWLLLFCSDVSRRIRIALYTVFIDFCTVVPQQFHATVSLNIYFSNNNNNNNNDETPVKLASYSAINCSKRNKLAGSDWLYASFRMQSRHVACISELFARRSPVS